MSLPDRVDQYQPMVCQSAQVHLSAIIRHIHQIAHRRERGWFEQLLGAVHNRQSLARCLPLISAQHIAHLVQRHLFFLR
jgi:hypothetical protein